MCTAAGMANTAAVADPTAAAATVYQTSHLTTTATVTVTVTEDSCDDHSIARRTAGPLLVA